MARARGEAKAAEGGAANDSIAHLNRLRESEKTGTLRFAPGEWGEGSIHLLGGTVIACATDDDPDLLFRTLLEAGVLSEDDTFDAEDTGTLADLLAADERVSDDQLADAEAQLFRTGLLRLLGPPRPEPEFEEKDAVFPRNMQFGFDIPALLEEIGDWRGRMDAVLSRCADDSRWQLNEASPLAAGVAGVLGNEPRTMSEILDSLGANRFLAVERAALLLVEGGLVPEGAQPQDATEAMSVADVSLMEIASEDLSGPLDGDADDSLELSLDSSAEGVELDLALDPEEEADTTDEGEGEDAVEDVDEGLTEADYEKAAAGGFIKSYEVLDKVDLSGVPVIGAGIEDPDATRPDGAADVSLGAIEAVGEIEVEVEGLEDDADDVPEIEVARGPAEDTDDIQLTPFETGDFEAVFDGGPVEVDIDASEDASVDGSLEVADTADQPPAPSGPLAALDDNARDRFDGPELEGFAERVAIFNHIFRIIFSTFSEHIGEAKARQRFNALLGSSQRQYPELFRRLEVEQDGSIETSSLINNLAACPPGDYGSLLHQGLYELIFSHLYDAKDLLPGDAETKMMEKIVVHERQLHDA